MPRKGIELDYYSRKLTEKRKKEENEELGKDFVSFSF